MVKKLKTHGPSPHKRGVVRVVQCGACGWLVACRSLADLLGAGWEMAQERGAWGFCCRTCAQEHPDRMGWTADAEQYFRSLPAAPPNPFPLIGGEGEKHADTSRPAGVDVQHMARP